MLAQLGLLALALLCTCAYGGSATATAAGGAARARAPMYSTGMMRSINSLGPGKGAWMEEPAAAHGLSAKLLSKAAEEVRLRAPNRYCLLVVKDGVIVHETYYANTSESVYESDSLAKTTTAAVSVGLFTESVAACRWFFQGQQCVVLD